MKFFYSLLLVLLPAFGWAQDDVVTESDSVATTDSSYAETDVYVRRPDSKGQPDTLTLEVRSFDAQQLDRLKNDPELRYRENPTVAETLWDRFLKWLAQVLEELTGRAVNTNWGNVFLYLAGLAVVVIIVMMLLKVNAFQVFYSGQGAGTMRTHALEENIHAIDFEREIALAVSAGDYRRGVRLVFLYSLKILSDKQLIHWQQGKTNHDYVAELSAEHIRAGFNELSYYFDYAWYGNFPVKPELFQKVQGIFKELQHQVK